MKSARFQLREDTILRILETQPRGEFLEIGYGDGEMLLTLSKLGFSGAGYDFSRYARQTAESKIKEDPRIRLLDAMPEQGSFDWIFFFEVIGYWENPMLELRQLASLLRPGGRLMFSFTGEGGALTRFSERMTGDMRCFSISDVKRLLEGAGFEIEKRVTYGFPLILVMRFLSEVYFRLRSLILGKGADFGVEQSGFGPRFSIFNPVTLWPFIRIQRWFESYPVSSGEIILARFPASQAISKPL